MFSKNIIIVLVLLLSLLTVSVQQKPPVDFQDKITSKADSVVVNDELDWNGAIVDMPTYNPTWPNAQILVMDFPREPIDNMPIIGMKEKKGYSLKSGKHPLKNGPGDVNKGQKDESAEQE
ncbi:MAG TPA: hypothetical protein VF181_02615 [Balneolaceae bacterium]